MKLQELGLKSKPATKYFSGGHISFSTSNKELFYKVFGTTKTWRGDLIGGKVVDKEQLDQLLSVKTLSDITEYVKNL